MAPYTAQQRLLPNKGSQEACTACSCMDCPAQLAHAWTAVSACSPRNWSPTVHALHTGSVMIEAAGANPARTLCCRGTRWMPLRACLAGRGSRGTWNIQAAARLPPAIQQAATNREHPGWTRALSATASPPRQAPRALAAAEARKAWRLMAPHTVAVPRRRRWTAQG